MNSKNLKQILDTTAGKDLVLFIESKILELDSCRTTKTDPVEVATEMRDGELAVDKLVEILKPLNLAKDVREGVIDKSEYVIE